MLKQEKGVTLVALVITIIVLLILAGISIAMLTGDNGLLTKSTDAKADHNVSQAKEVIGVKAADLLAEYYNQKYNNRTGEGYTAIAAQSAQEYVAAELASWPQLVNYATISTNTITVKEKTSDNKTVTGTVNSNGSITWNDPT